MAPHPNRIQQLAQSKIEVANLKQALEAQTNRTIRLEHEREELRSRICSLTMQLEQSQERVLRQQNTNNMQSRAVKNQIGDLTSQVSRLQAELEKTRRELCESREAQGEVLPEDPVRSVGLDVSLDKR